MRWSSNMTSARRGAVAAGCPVLASKSRPPPASGEQVNRPVGELMKECAVASAEVAGPALGTDRKEDVA